VLSKPYRWCALGILTLVYTLNQVDQGLISLLLQPIKDDLRLTDTQLGVLTGIAFGLFYATLGIPIARWADRGNRVTITSLAIGVWGVTVMLCVLVTNFIQLLLARVAAGIGESGCMPSTYSLVGEYFPAPVERTRAMSIYMLAGPLACLASFVIGGYLNEQFGWRWTFFLMGIPGLLVAVLVKMALVEPRASRARAEVADRHMPGMRDVLVTLWRQPSSRHLGIAIVLLFIMGLGLSPWDAAFMIRYHGLRTSELGLWLGLIFGLGGIVGVLLGGYVAAHWFSNNEKGQLRVTGLMVAAIVPSTALFLLLRQKQYALVALVPSVVVCNFFYGPSFSLMQRLVVDEMRATTVAVVMFLVNLIGMGVGPQVVGLMSDLLKPAFGADSLRYSMLAITLVALWSAYHFWRAGRTIGRDLVEVASRAPSRTVLQEPSGEIPIFSPGNE
jgi:MFS family permease